MNNAENVACNFCDWLIRMGYLDHDEKATDIEAMKKDFSVIENEAQKLFNLLKVLSD